MEINITSFISEAEPYNFSGSIAERGPNAGPETWANAKGEAALRPLLSDEAQLDAWRQDLKSMGYSEADNLTTKDVGELNALFIQYISGDIREAESLCPGDGIGGIDWNEYQSLSSEGTLGGRMYVADIGDNAGDVFFHVGD